MKRHSQYLTISIICFAIAITGLVMLWQGCSTLSYSEHARPIQCLDLATAEVSAYHDYYRRLCVGPTAKPGIGHAQMEVLIDGEWEAVQTFGDYADIGRHADFQREQCMYFLPGGDLSHLCGHWTKYKGE